MTKSISSYYINHNRFIIFTSSTFQRLEIAHDQAFAFAPATDAGRWATWPHSVHRARDGQASPASPSPSPSSPPPTLAIPSPSSPSLSLTDRVRTCFRAGNELPDGGGAVGHRAKSSTNPISPPTAVGVQTTPRASPTRERPISHSGTRRIASPSGGETRTARGGSRGAQGHKYQKRCNGGVTSW